MVEPRLRRGRAAVGAGRVAVVANHHHQVRAVALQLLVGLEPPARLDVEEAVEHQDRAVVHIASVAALPPPRVERGVLQTAAQARVGEADRRVETRQRVALQPARPLGRRGRADEPQYAGARH